jgi:NADH-quinone oxidoreductase subunit N
MSIFSAVEFELGVGYTQFLSIVASDIVLLAVAVATFCGGLYSKSRSLWASVAIVGMVLSLLPLMTERVGHNSLEWYLAVVADPLGSAVKITSTFFGLAFVLLTWHETYRDVASEFYGCLLILIAGVRLVASSNELVTLFLSLELISIPTYIMLFRPRQSMIGHEAAIKYFMLSVFSSAILLFGLSYVYGATGTTNVVSIASSPIELRGVVVVGVIMVVAGLSFRLTAVPFHFYAPDVFQGTSTGLAALLAIMPKIAGFVGIIRVFGYLAVTNHGHWLSNTNVQFLIWILAVITMTVGNIFALLQTNLRRMLAYSSVAHGGYMIMALASTHVGTSDDVVFPISSVLFYLAVYGTLTVGAFAVISLLECPERKCDAIDDLSGLYQKNPFLAMAMALFMLGLIGIPLTAGFSGKLQLFLSALMVREPIEARHLYITLAVIAAVNAAIGSFYYLNVISVMFLRPAINAFRSTPNWACRLLIVACCFVTIGLGVYPRPIVSYFHESVRGSLLDSVARGH